MRFVQLRRVAVPLDDRVAFHRVQAAWHTHTLPAGLIVRTGGWVLGAHEALLLTLWEDPDAAGAFAPPHATASPERTLAGSTEVLVRGRRGLVRAVQDAEHIALSAVRVVAPGLQLSLALPNGQHLGLWSSALHQAQAQPDVIARVRVVPPWRLPYRFRTPTGPEALRSP